MQFNEALVRVDALLHLAVQAEADTPPSSPAAGEAWIVGSAPTSEWADNAGKVALFSSGDWLFLQPTDGMRCWHVADRRFIHFDSVWSAAASPASPTGGATIDAEARQAIEEMIAALQASGIVSP
ncbi:DUF2793 domain-containing protein [Qipengyuania sp. CAU 1752]